MDRDPEQAHNTATEYRIDWLPLSSRVTPPPRVAWFRDEPCVFAGGWEPLSFRVRAGYGFSDEREYYYRTEFSDAALRELREMGCNHLVIPFEKGFGRDPDPEESAFLSNLIERAHGAGLRVGLYIRCDFVVPETLRREYSDVDEWLAEGRGGVTGTYGPQQQFRRKVSWSHPGPVRRIEDAFRAGAAAGADLFHLDGFHLAGKPEHLCRSARSQAAFRRWLRTRLSSEAEIRRTLGAADIEGVSIPDFDLAGLPALAVSPEQRLFYRFLWEHEFALVRHLRWYLHDLDPGIALTANPWYLSWGPYYRRMGQRIEWYFDWLDGLWIEDTEHLRFEGGAVVSRTAAISYAREAELPLLFYHWYPDAGRHEPGLAFACALNGGHLGCLGFTLRYMPHFRLCAEAKRRYVAFVRQHWRLLGNAVPESEVAVLRQPESLAWNHGVPWSGLPDPPQGPGRC